MQHVFIVRSILTWTAQTRLCGKGIGYKEEKKGSGELYLPYLSGKRCQSLTGRESLKTEKLNPLALCHSCIRHLLDRAEARHLLFFVFIAGSVVADPQSYVRDAPSCCVGL